MAKRIIWSREAVADRIQILDYWYKRLGSKQYFLFGGTRFDQDPTHLGHPERSQTKWPTDSPRKFIMNRKDNILSFKST